MIPPPQRFPKPRLRRLSAVVLACLAVALACGEREAPVDPNNRLCGGESGLALNVLGRSSPVEICIEDRDVDARFSSIAEYSVQGHMVAGNEIFDITMLFRYHDQFPVVLSPTGDLAAYEGDPDAVWIYYQEVPDGGEAIESIAITGGTFSLTFNDPEGTIVVGTLAGITLTMRNVADQGPAGAREFSEGFFSLSVKP